MPTLGGSARPFLENAASMDWSPDGRRIAYHGATDGDPVFVADVSGGDAIELFRGGEGRHCHYPAWSPDLRAAWG